MNYKILFIIIVSIIGQFLSYIMGYQVGVAQTHRDAYENGLMTIKRVNGNHVYRWIETHKLGYDYDK